MKIKTLVFFLLLVVVLELGLQLRVVLSQNFSLSPRGSASTVMVIGDSVMGDEQYATSIFGSLKRELPGVRFVNEVRPANSSFIENSKIDKVLKENKPDLALILLGNSDYVFLRDVTARPYSGAELSFLKYFYQSKIVQFSFSLFNGWRLFSAKNGELKTDRLVRNEFSDRKFKDRESIDSALKQDPQNREALSALGWLANEKNDCPLVIESFEKLFRLRAPSRRSLMVLKSCYFKENKIVRGKEFLDSFQNPTHLDKSIAQAFQIEIDPQKLSLDSLASADRDDYINQLFYFKRRNEPQKANELFLNRDAFAPLGEGEIDEKNFSSLVAKIVATGSQVIVLQYPNQSDWPILKILDSNSPGVRFVSLSNFFEKQLSNYTIYELLDEDFMHVSPLGAQVIARELGQIIRKQLGK